MTKLVTGATAFIGSDLCDALVALGAAVYGMSHRGGQATILSTSFGLKSLQTRWPLGGLPRVKLDLVYHLAGTVTGSEGLERVEPRLQNNLFDAVHLLLSVAETAVSRLSSWASRRIR